MILDVYSDGEELLASGFLFCVGGILLCITVILISRYKGTPKNSENKKKRLKVLSIISGIMTLICCALFLYVELYALPKAHEADRKWRENNPWSPANRNTIQSSNGG